MKLPRGLIGPIYAMARPRRPGAERETVIAAAGTNGSASNRARQLARAVAAAALADIDRDPAEHVIRLLRDLAPTPLDTLAISAEIDTAGLVIAERVRRLRARGGRRLSDREALSEDSEVIAAVASILSERYRRYLAKK
ncbi:hypothetical protein [Edaphosphingomonas haloaromaticamans]|uniref:Uncharacterized protein n=1 Tax=Edaphosphingomonas haloaromaticamans TaxID=653954 RepID=A0A1S1HLB9_9SPHN|nr:hypothetical protein [Sphingomonas haloaromaticamans]OHT22186.1 hypothetical protein BHE75_04210 [Sphingomonas haloaromaticamans]